MKDKIETIVDVCNETFDEVEPAVCLVAMRLGIEEAETCAPLFGNDTVTYRRCLAAGKERMASDAAYARSIRRACVAVMSEVVRSALAELGIPHGERQEGDRYEVKFEAVIGESPVIVRIEDAPGIIATTISARVPGQVEQEAKAFCAAACRRWAMLGKLVVEDGHFAYDYRPDVATVLDIPVDEVSVVMLYGAKVIKGFEPAMQAIAQGLDASSALKLCTTTLPLR